MDGGEAWDFPSPACPAGLRVTPPRPSWSLILGNSGRHSNRSTLAAAGVESYLQEQENFKRLEYGCLKSASTLPIKPANNVEPQHFLDASYVLATTGSHSEPSYSAQRQRSTPAFSRGRLSAQNPHTVLSRICMKLDIKTVD